MATPRPGRSRGAGRCCVSGPAVAPSAIVTPRFVALASNFTADEGAIQPIDAVTNRELAERVEYALSGLPSREAYVLRERYGIGTGDDHTLADLGEALGISPERVRQIEAAALHHLQMSAHVEMLREFLDGAAVPERTPRPCEGGRQSVPRTKKSRSRRFPARITEAA